MSRFLVAHLPAFRLERCGWSPHRPAVLVAEERGALRVLAATPAARRGGVRPGLTATEARALLPGVALEPLDAEAEARDLAELSDQLVRFAPAAAPLPPESVVADLSHLPRGRAGAERVVVERVRRRLRDLGHIVRVVVADDPATALACAAWGRRDLVVPPGEGPRALAPLPLDALELPEEERALLAALGIRTVGAFAALPPAAVAARLGPVGRAAHALARGRLAPPAPLPPRGDTAPPTFRQELPGPVEVVEAVLFVVHALLRDATSHLAATGRGAARLRLRLELDGAPPHDLSVALGRPTRDPHLAFEALRPRLEALRLPAPVTAVELSVPDVPRHEARQLSLARARERGEDLARAVALIQDALGMEAVAFPEPVDRLRPEAAWRPRPVEPARLERPPPRPAPPPPGPGDDPVAEWLGLPARRGPEGPVPLAGGRPPPELRPRERPPLLLPAPEAIEARGGVPPVAVRVDGRWVEVRRARGPERLRGEWWSRPLARDCWRLDLADGRVAWTFVEDGRWVLHGWWDR